VCGGNFLTGHDDRNIHFLVGALSMDGIVAETEDMSNLNQECGFLIFVGGGHNVLVGKWHTACLIIGFGQNCPKTALLSWI
jgi:hypothetical protein